MVAPRIQLVAYESRDPSKVFVFDPMNRGRYLLVDRVVVDHACEQCKAVAGEPCKGNSGRYTVGVHWRRGGNGALRPAGRREDRLDPRELPPEDTPEEPITTREQALTFARFMLENP